MKELSDRPLDIFIGSKEIKKVIRERITTLGISAYVLCEELGVDYKIFKENYLNIRNPATVHGRKMKHEDLLKILEALNISAKITVILGDIDGVDKERFSFKKFKINGPAGRKEKGTSE